MTIKVVIMGAAGRDFHNFNLYFKNRPEFRVIAFTATQIPGIEGRRYPPSLAGPLYPDGIPILPESSLEDILKKNDVDLVVLAYSDLTHDEVMHKASRVIASGSDFMLLGPKATMLKSNKPVVAITATRTGAGKSTVSRYVINIIRDAGKRVVVVRHPMPYGDLEKQVVQRFESIEDLDKYGCTIEEREEYEPHLVLGVVVYSGVDYIEVLRRAEMDGDVLIWDGGNNDFPFIKPSVNIVVTDAQRPGQEASSYPGEVNIRMADVVVINKSQEVSKENLEIIKQNIARINPNVRVVVARSKIIGEGLEKISGRRVIVVEDGPTVTHGGFSYGAGYVAAKKYGAEIIDPRPYATGVIKKLYEQYRHIGNVVPAVGYNNEQIRDLEETLMNADCEFIVSATPTDLSRIIKINKEMIRIRYELDDLGDTTIKDVLREKGII
ncbi:MAG: cyclic 2,3-diphosphoglycerate synthase [Nitrososphaerota archaeon]